MLFYLFIYRFSHSQIFIDTTAMQFVISGIAHYQVVTQQLTNSQWAAQMKAV